MVLSFYTLFTTFVYKNKIYKNKIPEQRLAEFGNSIKIITLGLEHEGKKIPYKSCKIYI